MEGLVEPELFDKQQLRDYAAKHDIEISSGQFDDWKSQDLLPPAIPDPSQQGRGRRKLLYPRVAATAAVMWLGRHRLYIKGDDVAKFWMSLEGFDYIQVDVCTVVLNRIIRFWASLQANILPSLPDIAVMAQNGISEELRLALLDELDDRYTNAKLQSGTWTDRDTGQATLLAAILGIIPGDYIRHANPDKLTEGSDIDVTAVDSMTSPQAVSASAEEVSGVAKVIEMAHLLKMYQALSNQELVSPHFHLMWHVVLSSENLPLLWPTISRITGLQAVRPKNHDELLRMMDYEPLNLAVLVFTFKYIGAEIRASILAS
jgi:hypothetical protein